MKRSAAAVLAVIILSGCGAADETYRPAVYTDISDKRELTVYTEVSDTAEAYAYSSHSESNMPAAPDGVLRQTFTSDDGELVFTVENVFSGGEYYTVTASASRTDIKSENTVYINGELYGEPVLTLHQQWRKLDTVKLDIPDGDSFLTLESAADNYSYGSEIISNMREFGAAEYPDILGLVFRSTVTEAAVPEYARYFAVFDGKLTELEIYDNDSKVSPRGAKLEPVSAGLAKQFLTVLKTNGTGYEIIKYEYRFDLENRRLNRQQVRFYGWDY